MSLTKTLNPAGVLVSINGNDLSQPQVFEDIVDSIGGVNDLFVPLTGAPYNIVADDASPSVATSNTAAINQAVSDYSGTGATLVLPKGTVTLGQASGGAQYSIYFGPDTSKLSLMGQGMEGTRLVQEGQGDGGDWHAIVVDRASQISLSDFHIEQGVIKAPDPIQLNHLINITNPSTDATGNTSDINLTNISFGKCLGDQLRTFGDTAPVKRVIGSNLKFSGAGVCIQNWAASTTYVTGEWVRNDSGKNYICTAGGVSASSGGPTGTAVSGIIDGGATWGYKAPRNGARTCVSVQRGYDVLRLSKVYAEGAQNSVLDVEPTAAGGGYAGTETMQYLEITDSFFDNSSGSTAYAATFSGITAGTKSKYNRLENVTIKNGALYLIQTTSTSLHNVNVINRSLFAADTSTPNILIRQTNDDLVMTGLRLERGGACAAGLLLDMEEGSRPVVSGLFGVQETTAGMLSFEGTTRVTVRDSFIYYSGSTPSGKDVVAIMAINSDANFPVVEGITADTASGKFRSVVGLYTRSSQSMTNVAVRNIHAPGKTNYGVLFSVAAGTTMDTSPIVMGVDATGDVAWRSEDASEVEITTIFPIVGGNPGSAVWIEGSGAPSGSQPVGSMYSRKDGGVGTSLYTYVGGVGWVSTT